MTVGFALLRPKVNQFEIIGSGVIASSDERIVITARHVVDNLIKAATALKAKGGDPRTMVLLPSGDPVSIPGPSGEGGWEMATRGASIMAMRTHNDRDLAAVQLSEPPAGEVSLVQADLAPKLDVREGDEVAACGWPMGLKVHEGKGMISSFAAGCISAVIPHPLVPALERTHYLTHLHVTGGNSGGPVFDIASGKVFGLVSRGWMNTALSVVEPIGPIMAAVDEDWSIP